MPETVDLMLSNQLSGEMFVKNIRADPLLGVGFGLGWGLVADPAISGAKIGVNSAFWSGAAGAWIWVDPEQDFYFIGMVQCMAGCEMAGGQNSEFFERSASLIKAAQR